MIRGIRGATTVSANKTEIILSATKELLSEIFKANPTLKKEDLAAVWFTVTDDLDAVYPAEAARQMGWKFVPLMCAQELRVPGGLRKCIRVLLFWNTDLSQESIVHKYLRGTVALRPDLVE